MTGSNGNKTVEIPYRLKTIQLAELKPHPKQAEVREISDEAFTALSNFIGEVGLVEEISINDRTGHIISGHQRCKVLISQGYTTAKVKVFDVDENTEDMMFTNLNSAEVSGRFTDTAKSFVQSLEARLGSEMYQEVGLRMLEVSLADPQEDPKDGLTDPDDVPEITKTKIKTGDLYQLGNHRLLCGDATKAEDVERLMGGEKADIVVTDPPYNVGKDYGDGTNDNLSEAAYREFLCAWFDLCQDVSERQIVTIGRRRFEEGCWSDLPLKATGCWTKVNAISRGRITQSSCWEPILFIGSGWNRKRANDVFDFPIGNQLDVGDHPCPKPMKLWVELISCYSAKDDVVYDPFLGSGTTMIACEQLDRKCYGIEIEPRYVNVAIQRWEQFTGQQAQLLSRAE